MIDAMVVNAKEVEGRADLQVGKQLSERDQELELRRPARLMTHGLMNPSPSAPLSGWPAARVPRMRPIFQEWTADVRLNVEDGTVNLARVDE